ncbi:hypothetical protein WJX74_003956 [Apatococcus lobatus]|uniref:DUF7887 domain-containing protein n=1 Tax=Apatococcus lobatus TaxID=904363 RepID=A0AAW1RC09_9CHLO
MQSCVCPRGVLSGLCTQNRLWTAPAGAICLHSPTQQKYSGPRIKAQRSESEASDGSLEGPLASVKQIASSNAYKWGFEGVIAVGLFMLVDAAYSGDWSRIGAISKETETQLKGVAPLVGVFHLLCAPVAAIVASRRGLSTPKAVAKTLLIGGPALFEIVLSDTTE